MNDSGVIYFYNDCVNKEFICTGVRISDLVRFIEQLSHIIIVKGECIGDKLCNNFEVFDNRKSILEAFSKDQRICGDLCFIDYESENSPDNLSCEEISYMLYCAHMFRVERSMKIDTLNNHLICMSHDNSFFVKIYYDSIDIISNIVIKKILNLFNREYNCDLININDDVKHRLVELCSCGVLITKSKIQKLCLEMNCIGLIDNMDEIYNNTDTLKAESNIRYTLSYNGIEWNIS